MSGPVVCHGVPHSGKSTLIEKMSAELGIPIAVHDPALVPSWARLPHHDSLTRVIMNLFGSGKSVAWSGAWDAVQRDARGKPKDRWPNGAPVTDGDRLCNAIRSARVPVALVLDEYRYIGSQNGAPMGLVLLTRGWRHAQVSLFIGTQRINDVHGDVLTAVSRVFHFCAKSPRVLEFCEKEYRVDPARLESLKVGEFIEQSLGLV